MDYSNKIISGTAIAKDIISEVKTEVANLISKNKSIPHLKVILVGDNKEALSYVKSKEKTCARAGIKMSLIQLDSKTTQGELIKEINKIQNDKSVDGLMVEMPLPKHINADEVVQVIKPEFDVDCLNHNNRRLVAPQGHKVAPCTALAVMEIIDREKIDLNGLNIVIIGRSKVVGNPLATLMLERAATVTICSSKTKNVEYFTSNADLIVTAVGSAKFLKQEQLSKDQIIIDVGINFADGKLCGDVDFDDVIESVKKITPVPGGVGPVTSTMILKRLLSLYKNKRG